jgi:hypothetical protein
MVVIGPTGKTCDEITGNKTRQVRTHTWAPDTSPKLKYLQDLIIRINSEVTKEVAHHAGMWVNGGLHLHLHVCKIIHPSLESFDPFHHALSLVNPMVSCGDGTKDEDRSESCDPLSPKREPEPRLDRQTRVLASLHSTTSSPCTTLATTTHNNKYLAPLV